MTAGSFHASRARTAGWQTSTVTNEPELTVDTETYASGAQKFSGFRLDGELHGTWRWYRTDGSLMRTGAFDRGKQVGTWQTFDRSGRLVRETRFG
jgi:antitoxin component YwqK of YwqJK toxin-antitoxin module